MLGKSSKGVEIVCVEFKNLIDKEDILLDSERLKEFNDKQILRNKIDDLAEGFIGNNISADDFENITMIYKFAEQIKEKII